MPLKNNSIEVKYARSQYRAALIDLLWENGMEHVEPIEDYLLAVCDDAVVGCARLEDFADLAMIRPVAVSPDHRKKGIGRRLIQHIMPEDKPTVVVGRGDAVSFYKALGFEKISWGMIPAIQQDECRCCPVRASCRPQPMICGQFNES